MSPSWHFETAPQARLFQQASNHVLHRSSEADVDGTMADWHEHQRLDLTYSECLFSGQLLGVLLMKVPCTQLAGHAMVPGRTQHLAIRVAAYPDNGRPEQGRLQVQCES